MPGVPVVPVFPWLMGDLDFDPFSVSDCEFVVSQSFSFSSPEDVPPLSRGRTQEVDCGVDQKWERGTMGGASKNAHLSQKEVSEALQSD